LANDFLSISSEKISPQVKFFGNVFDGGHIRRLCTAYGVGLAARKEFQAGRPNPKKGNRTAAMPPCCGPSLLAEK
jgi:hypothetical protein